jgi:hypothetical protein
MPYYVRKCVEVENDERMVAHVQASSDRDPGPGIGAGNGRGEWLRQEGATTTAYATRGTPDDARAADAARCAS